MATFNCVETVGVALESIADQSYGVWELVICDDASTDGTFEVVQAFADRYPEKVVLLRNEVNSKLAASLNRCLEHISGELVARMDGDDISVPERFETQVRYLQEHPEVDLVGTAMQRFDSTGLKDVHVRAPFPGRESMRSDVPFFHATIMARAKVYEELGGYTVSWRTQRAEDYDLWFRFFDKGFVGHNLDVPLYQVREDMAAIKRRTLSVRLQGYRTTLFGFRLLGYPKHWYLRPTLELLKVLVPARAVLVYRNLQYRRYVKRVGAAESGNVLVDSVSQDRPGIDEGTTE